MALPTKKSSLPPQWVSEIENVENAPQNSDTRLDAFLERFQTEIVAARQLKNRLGSCPREDYAQLKTDFKHKMTNVWKLFSKEGEQYVQSLDVGEADGNDTDELQRGIERLESAVKKEESKRIEKRVGLEDIVSPVTPEEHIVVEKPDRDVGKMRMKPTEMIACTVNSDETLQLMRSDIQALKLELVKLQRSKATENTDVTTNPNPTTIQSTAPTTTTFTSPELGRLNTNVSVVRVTGRANIAPTYINHLEQMKSRLEALEKKPVARRAKSAARLGRTHTIGSMYGESAKTVMTYGTPPGARMKHRSISTQSPVMDKTPVEVRMRALSSAGSTPSPERGDNAARMLFDAPEELLQRPQSHAAARDMQRYSIKVARRLGVDNGRGSIEARAQSAVTTGQAAASKPVLPPSTPHAASDIAPSTMDTSGSGGRVVEEIEGDMWVRKGVMWKRWRKRYASIVSHQFFGKVLCLFCYDGQGGVMSKRSQIVVLNGSVCRAERERGEFGKEGGKFVFALRTRSKEYLFAADSDEMRWNWIRELRDAARVGRGRSMAFRK